MRILYKSMYFESREQAGEKLAEALFDYRFEDCSVLALSPGGVVVGAVIAEQLKCDLSLLLTAPIKLPKATRVLGSIDQAGNFTKSGMISTGELETIYAEMHNYIEEEKLHKMHEMSQMLGQAGVVQKQAMADKHVIVVNDASSSGIAYLAAANFLKTVSIKSFVGALPVASLKAVDRLHYLSDKIVCLNTTSNFMGADHYFNEQGPPDQETVMKLLDAQSDK